MNKIWLCLFFIFVTINQITGQRIMTYNVLNYQGSVSGNSEKEISLRMVIESVDPDIIVVEEINNTTGFNRFLSNILNYNQAGIYSGADFTNSEICIVYNINGVETTNEEKIKYAEKFYKKIASESLEKNSWILSSKSDFKDTTDNKNKGNTVEQLEALTRLFESGALTEEEFKSAKKKILND